MLLSQAEACAPLTSRGFCSSHLLGLLVLSLGWTFALFTSWDYRVLGWKEPYESEAVLVVVVVVVVVAGNQC